MTETKIKIPKYTPYLSNRWDRLDEYHTLNSKEVTEKDFATWWAVVFKRGKVKTLESALKLPKYELNYITRSVDSGYHGSWQVDLYGGMFGCMGMYQSSDFYMEWFPREILNGKDTNQKRFDYIQGLIVKYFEI
jgi:hypothetical protein